MPDFNVLTPPVDVTKPDASLKDFPRHLYQWGQDYKVVLSQTEMDEAVADGWELLPVLTEPKKKAEKAEKPAKAEKAEK